VFAGDAAAGGDDPTEQFIQTFLGTLLRARLRVIHHHVCVDVAIAGVTEAGKLEAVFFLQRGSEFEKVFQLAARHALQTGNPEWTARAFQAVEINRAASLRESLALADVWREKLPPEYWETLAQLGAEEARERRAETGGSRMDGANANRLRLRLTEMEAETGIGLQVKKVENFRSRISLIHFQQGLRVSELFLSFELGEKESYLWTVSRSSLRLYR